MWSRMRAYQSERKPSADATDGDSDVNITGRMARAVDDGTYQEPSPSPSDVLPLTILCDQ